jgi:4-hydroxybenzoate polyprenyltransferase
MSETTGDQKRSIKNCKSALCVDLDGTLIKTDMLYESVLLCIFRYPWIALCVPFWLLRGRAHLKTKLASKISIAPESLPYNQDVLDYIKATKAGGTQTVLATASDKKFAEAIAEHLGIFDEVIASDGKTNLTGSNKLKVLQSKYPAFDYIGNEVRDRKIWRGSQNSIIVAKSEPHAKRIGGDIKFTKILINKVSTTKNIIKALRTHQWVKNILLFVPLFLSHRWNEPELVIKSFFAFASFSICASAFYIFNDLSDLESDRLNPSKKNRPFASGALSVGFGIMMIPALLGISLLLALNTDPGFFNVLLAYALLTSLYSSVLKKIAVLDVVVLASFYALRLFAGSLAISVPISHWLLAFSMFIFLSLAFAKRFSELYSLRGRNEEKAKGRGYYASDLEQVAQLGSSSGYISALVMALYLNSSEVAKLYSNPKLLWLICPLLLYWIGRIWILAHRGQLHEDPIVFALKDRVSYIVGAVTLAIILIAI